MDEVISSGSILIRRIVLLNQYSVALADPGWCMIRVWEGSAMRRANPHYFYSRGVAIHRLDHVEVGDPRGQAREFLYAALRALDNMLGDSESPLGTSKPVCAELRDSVKAAAESADPVIYAPELDYIRHLLTEFEGAFAAYLQILDCYVVDPKGIFATTMLIDHADHMFPESIRRSLPDAAREDILRAGKCLAFELPTAFGFHALRAIESVIRRYYEVLKQEALVNRLPTWDAYIKKLREARAPEKVLVSLTQIKDFHRNPLMHPEDSLDMAEAMILVGIVQSAITAMVAEFSNL